ncbi:MAG: hypothetical protein WC378_15765 [Opitutaceae bacterium]|jgi:Xaa-Pro aminopeptidase
MQTTFARSSAIWSLRPILLAALFLGICLQPLHAVYGVLDTVIIVGDETDLMKWPRELQQWNRVVYELQQQVRKSEELLKRKGTVSSSAPQMAGAVASVTDASAAALALETRNQALERGKQENGLSQKRRTVRAKAKVDPSYQVLGAKYQRDEKRYEPLAMQEALRQRQTAAIDAQDKVAQKEFTLQRGLLEKLRAAKTEADVQALHAALAASQQRIELVRQKTEQARDDCALFEAELALETARKRSADEEWAEKFVEKLRARALTSLHAQKGENS